MTNKSIILFFIGVLLNAANSIDFAQAHLRANHSA